MIRKNTFRLLVFLFLLGIGANTLKSQTVSAPKVEAANACLERLAQANRYTESLSQADFNILPVGIKRVVGNSEVIIAVDKAIFHKDYTELSVFGKVTVPQKGENGFRPFFFGAKGIKLSHDGSIIGDAALTLLENIEIPFNNGNTSIVLKGDYDSTTGNSRSATYISIDCKGFKELGLDAEVLFPTTLMTANRQGDNLQQVRGTFRTVVSNWNDLIAKVDIPAFQIVGLNGFVFDLQDVVLDFSDMRNESSIRFPNNYEQKYLISGSPTLWRGVYAKNIHVTLPPEFNSVQGNPTTIQAQNFIIDDNGITGIFSANNVLDFDNGSAGGWSFSVTRLGIEIEANRFIAAGFGGEIGLPFKGDKTRLGYNALINPNGEYVMQVSSIEEIDFSLFNAKAKILPNSYVSMQVRNGRFYPEAMLHGSMSFLPDNSTSETVPLNIPSLEFRSMRLRTESPYISIEYLGYSGKTSLAGFPVSMSNLALQSNGESVSLSSNLDITLGEKMFAGGTRLSITGRMVEENSRKRWQYESTRIDAIRIDASIAEVLRLKGAVNWMKNDPIYGDGFMGDLDVGITLGTANALDVKMRGAFGSKDNSRYWFVDGSVVLPQGLPVFPPLSLKGFSGGVTYGMRADGIMTNTSGTSFTSMRYVPDKEFGLGLKAAVLFNVEKVAAGEACFDLAFSRSGGLNYAGFYGFAKFPEEGSYSLGINPSGLSDKYAAIIGNENILGKAGKALEKWKQFEPNKAAEVVNPIPSSLDFGIRGTLGIQYDVRNKSLHATSDIFINSPGGFIEGVGSKNRAGWFVFHVDPSEWYLHLGSPTDRLGIQLNVGNILSVKSGSYLMAGSRIPEMPPPPQEVATLINEDLSNLRLGRNIEALSTGKGFAFGSDFRIQTGDLTFLMMYANFLTGMGFDIMLKDYGQAQCKGRTGVIGMNGWYASGQAYAYLQGELGVKVNLWLLKKKIPVIKGGAAALMQAMLPNPTSFKGYLGVNLNVLGIIKGKARFKLSLGDECELVNPGGSPVEMAMINDISPADRENSVSVFTAPQATFNMSIGKPFDVQDDSGNKIYRIQLKSFDVTDEKGKTITGNLKWSKDKNAVSLQPKEILPPNATLKANIQVSFEENINGRWSQVYTSGKEAVEAKQVQFVTGGAPENIPLQNIVYSYPVVDQRYFLADESRDGIVQLQFGQKYLFEKGFEYKLSFTSALGSKVETPFKYNESQNRLEYTIPELGQRENYTVTVSYTPKSAEATSPTIETKTLMKSDDAIVTMDTRKANATMMDNTIKSILDFDFSTSRFKSFTQKVQSFGQGTDAVIEDAGVSVRFLSKVRGEENFDEAEIVGIEKSDNKPLVKVKAALIEDFYTTTVAPLVYNGYPYNGLKLRYRDDHPIGVPPHQSISIYSPYLLDLQKGSNPATFWLPYSYDTPITFVKDFRDLQAVIVNNRTKVPSNIYSRFAMGDIPFPKKGLYQIRLTYILPNGKETSSVVFNFNNFSELND